MVALASNAQLDQSVLLLQFHQWHVQLVLILLLDRLLAQLAQLVLNVHLHQHHQFLVRVENTHYQVQHHVQLVQQVTNVPQPHQVQHNVQALDQNSMQLQAKHHVLNAQQDPLVQIFTHLQSPAHLDTTL